MAGAEPWASGRLEADSATRVARSPAASQEPHALLAPGSWALKIRYRESSKVHDLGPSWVLHLPPRSPASSAATAGSRHAVSGREATGAGPGARRQTARPSSHRQQCRQFISLISICTLSLRTRVSRRKLLEGNLPSFLEAKGSSPTRRWKNWDQPPGNPAFSQGKGADGSRAGSVSGAPGERDRTMKAP